VSRANIVGMLELSENQLARNEAMTTVEKILAIQNGDESAAVSAVYSKGVTDGLRCALLMIDGATIQEAADYMIAALSMGPQEGA
jgi:hypothetical protein